MLASNLWDAGQESQFGFHLFLAAPENPGLSQAKGIRSS